MDVAMAFLAGLGGEEPKRKKAKPTPKTTTKAVDQPKAQAKGPPATALSNPTNPTNHTNPKLASKANKANDATPVASPAPTLSLKTNKAKATTTTTTAPAKKAKPTTITTTTSVAATTMAVPPSNLKGWEWYKSIGEHLTNA
jgi:hypothetical protein